jgi:hypothetical protein
MRKGGVAYRRRRPGIALSKEVEMGWTFTFKPKHQSLLAFFRDRWVSSMPGREREILDCAVVARKTAYVACRVSCEKKEPYVFAAICFLAYRPHDEFNFGFKDCDESMGPYAYECPERILKLLTDLPEPSEHSKNWREKCWANLAARKTAPRLAVDVMIKTAEPVKFFGGIRESLFTCEEPRRRLFVASSGRHSGLKFLLTRDAVRSATLMTPSGAA